MTPAELKQRVRRPNKGKKPGTAPPETAPWWTDLVMQPLPGGLPYVPPGTVASTLPWNLPTFPARRRGVIHLGPIPLRGYAFCIIIGVFVAVWLGNKRWIARGGRPAPWRTSPSGPCRSVWSAAGSTTSSPTTSCTSARVRTGSTPSRSGRAASASGAPSRSARWAPGSAAAGAGSRCPRGPTPSRPASPSRRPSAAGATGSTRSCTAGRRTCRGRCRSRPRRTGRVPGYYHPTFLYESLWCIGRRAARHLGRPPLQARPRPRLRPVRRRVLRGPRLDRVHAGRRGPPLPGPAPQRLDRVIVFVLAVVYIVLSARYAPGVRRSSSRSSDADTEGRCRRRHGRGQGSDGPADGGKAVADAPDSGGAQGSEGAEDSAGAKDECGRRGQRGRRVGEEDLTTHGTYVRRGAPDPIRVRGPAFSCVAPGRVRPAQGEGAVGRRHHRRVDEAAVGQGQGARLPGGGLDDLLGRFDLLRSGQVGALDDRELAGMDRRAAEEAQRAAVGAGRGQSRRGRGRRWTDWAAGPVPPRGRRPRPGSAASRGPRRRVRPGRPAGRPRRARCRAGRGAPWRSRRRARRPSADSSRGRSRDMRGARRADAVRSRRRG